MSEEKKYFPNWKKFRLEKNLIFVFTLKIPNSFFLNMKRCFLGVFLVLFFCCVSYRFLFIVLWHTYLWNHQFTLNKKFCDSFVFYSFSYFDINRYFIKKFNRHYGRVYSSIYDNLVRPYYIFFRFGRRTSVARRDQGGGLALPESCWGCCRSRYDARKNPKSAMKTVHHWRPTLMHLGCRIEIAHE